jgi:hypothetical protein
MSFNTKKPPWFDTVTAIILAVASVVSSWCAYQSSKWNGEQSLRLDEEDIADNLRLQAELVAAQRQSGEANLFLYYAQAVATGNEPLRKFLEARFPLHMKEAFDAWKATNPANNAAAPASPFQMKEYIVPEKIQAQKYEDQASAYKKSANEAGEHSDNYLLLSIIIAMVLFFTGLAGIMKSYQSQRILLITAITLLVVVLVMVSRLPITV